MNRYLKVSNAEGMVRDMNTGAVLNKNVSEYESYVKRKELVKKSKEELVKQTEEINNLKNELSEIKQMLIALMNK
jgi:hypothetical protein